MNTFKGTCQWNGFYTNNTWKSEVTHLKLFKAHNWTVISDVISQCFILYLHSEKWELNSTVPCCWGGTLKHTPLVPLVSFHYGISPTGDQ